MSETLTEAPPLEAVADPPAEKKKSEPTTYNILKVLGRESPGSKEIFEEYAFGISALGADAAIRKAVTGTDQVVNYIAVPVRNFKRVPVVLDPAPPKLKLG